MRWISNRGCRERPCVQRPGIYASVLLGLDLVGHTVSKFASLGSTALTLSITARWAAIASSAPLAISAGVWFHLGAACGGEMAMVDVVDDVRVKKLEVKEEEKERSKTPLGI